MRALLLAALLLPAVAFAQPTRDEAAVGAALDRLVLQARSGGPVAVAPLLACYSGVDAPGALVVRPCVATADSARVAAVTAQVREAFGPDMPYVLDWYQTQEDTGQARHIVQVKIRDTDPATPVVYSFIRSGPSLLLADAGALFLTPPEAPPPADAQDEAQRRFETLLRLVGHPEEAAAHIACYDLDPERIYRCAYDAPADRARVDRLLARLQTFLQTAGSTGWGFAGYREKDEREGRWHLLQIDYLADGTPNGPTATFYAAFIRVPESDGPLALGDLVGDPD